MFWTPGKLLLFGEYAVLSGGLALAIATQQGQKMKVKEAPKFSWKAYDHQGKLWSHDEPKLSKVFAQMNFRPQKSFETFLEFPRHWGLGSSATLYVLLARWANIDPLNLYFKCEQGSGCDVACSDAGKPIFYQQGKIEAVKFNPPFKQQLYLLFCGQKASSEEAVAQYRQRPLKTESIKKINEIVKKSIATENLTDFEMLIREHEDILAAGLTVPPVKQKLFADYWGEVKSLGAWGGDALLITSSRSVEETRAYFKDKGFSEFFAYDEIAL